MLVNDDKLGKKKRKDYQRAMKKKRNCHSKGGRWLLAGAGGVLSLVTVLLIAVGMISLTASAQSLTLVTNTGYQLEANDTVMDGAQVYINGYAEESKIYYWIKDTPFEDTSGLDLSTNGIAYATGSSITMTRSSTDDGVRYLYIQEKKNDGNSIISSYKISFYNYLDGASSTPSTSDSDMTAVSVGQEITFAGEGTMYYTLDGSEPYFERVSGDTEDAIVINNEYFIPGNPEMTPFDFGNKITVTEEWMTASTKTIRVIAYAQGKDFSPETIFRFKVTQEQAKSPVISPATTTEKPITVDSGTSVTLNTETEGGVILYTINGGVPVYSVEGNEIVGGTDTHIYSGPFPISGEPGEEIIITAVTVKISSAGFSIMRDSDPVQFIYNITPLGTASPPEVSPESGTELALNSKIYLNTSTSDGIILYTTDGSSPDYDIEDGKLVKKGTTQVYGEQVPYIVADETNASPGQTFLVQAKTIKINTTGEKLLEDSAVRQFSFPISDAERVASPSAIPKTSEKEPATVKEGDRIMLSCTTAGAQIYYTLDGTAPVINADGSLAGTTKLYNAQDAIVVPAGIGYLTVTAMARKTGMNDSFTVQFNYQYPGTVAPPYVTPAEGTVSINTEITLASLDKNAQIYYTLDGTVPTVSTGRLYSEPILLTQDTVIKAICVVDGISSAVRTFTFKVAPELVPPTPSIQSGAVVTSGTTINLSAQQGAQIFYTLDGSSPKTDKAMAGSTVTLTGKAGDAITLITYAKGSNYSDSQTATYVYTISNYENGIKANPEPGSKVKAGDVITLETDVTNGTIYYAVGGNSPDSSGMQGTQVTVGESGNETKFTLKATVVSDGSSFTGSIASFIYEYMEKPVAPKASVPNGAVLLQEQNIVLTTESGDIYYTLDETEPDSKSDIYTEPIQITQAATIKAITISKEGAESDVATFAYTFAEQIKAPVFSIKSGEVESGTMLTITSDTPGAVIYYTTDGQIPDLNNPKNLYIYSGAIAISKPVNIKAIAVKDKMINSEVTSAIYTVKEPEIIVVDEELEEEEKQKSGDRLMSRRAYMNEEGGPTYSDFVLKSAATGVVVSAQEGAIPVESKIEVTETVVDSALNYAVESGVGQEYGAVSSYEVSLNLGTEELEPSGDVEIGLPVSPQYRNNAISIAYVNEDGNVETYETRRDNDMVYAHITHFGRYCIVAPVNFDEEESEEDIVKMIRIVAVVLLVAGYILLRLGRKKSKQKSSILDD
ncbi:MAG: chitobiase/beta-hexosaminidase C-terminal domain-containing protein [Suilimivivens sp.]